MAILISITARGTIEDHEIKIYSDKILEQDKNLVVNGNYISVENTKYDFIEFHKIGEKVNGGYDQSFVIDKKDDQLTIVGRGCVKKIGFEITGIDNRAIGSFLHRPGISKDQGEKQYRIRTLFWILPGNTKASQRN